MYYQEIENSAVVSNGNNQVNHLAYRFKHVKSPDKLIMSFLRKANSFCGN